jgi:hypothetical protein
LCSDRTRTSAAGVCASPDAAATAGFQSIQSRYRASTELQTYLVHNTNVPSSEVTLPANEGRPRTTARSHHRWRAPVYGARSVFGPIVIGPPPVLCRLRLSVRLATVVGRILVSNLALFLVRRDGSRPTTRSCLSWCAERNLGPVVTS